jgi:hypothetical protein
LKEGVSMSDQTVGVKAVFEDGHMVFQLDEGMTVIFKDHAGATILTIGEDEINANVTFKAPTVSTEGA